MQRLDNKNLDPMFTMPTFESELADAASRKAISQAEAEQAARMAAITEKETEAVLTTVAFQAPFAGSLQAKFGQQLFLATYPPPLLHPHSPKTSPLYAHFSCFQPRFLT